MSAISLLYDGMVTILATVFPEPAYKALPNPYIPELNDELFLKRGVSFFVGPKTGPGNLGRYESFEADLIVIQTIKIYGTDRDIAIRLAAEKNLLEDQFLLIDYFRVNTSTIDKVWDISYISDGGLEFIFSDKQNYIMIRTTLKAKFAEAC